ncbi:SufS family cysteine desulfurase [Saxibacter everestensis]|uniref:Cysteine desulfurase n=1 Tax=Saxibacter everestensis TaxID=2909229 RepID=A0ABY8QXP2_9MICO|nr:SufS family cysteine desulfurase [Brevibacteriaceae bacterium ZFBP1038]
MTALDSARTQPLEAAEVARIRNDFPIFDVTVNGYELAYLDSGATSQKPVSVLEAEQEFYAQRNSAVHRGAHQLAVAATDAFEAARATVAQFIGAADNEVVWTKNATEALNIVAYGMSNASLGRGGAASRRFALAPGDELVVTEMEHHANLVPWQELAARTGATLRFIPILADGRLDLDAAASIIGPRTRLLAVTHASNVLGTINPIAELVAMARAHDALVVLDACQSVPHLTVDVKELDIDFAAFSGHKMLGPTGIGVLYGKAELLDALPPVLTGGSMITTVTMEAADYLPAPQRFEAGTQPIAEAVGLAAAVNYLSETGMERIAGWEAHLAERLAAGIAAIPGVRLLGPPPGEERIAVASFDVDGVHAHDVGQFLDDRGVAVRVGHHCAQPLHRRLGLTATTRASGYLYTTDAEIDVFLAGLAEVRSFFGVDAA